MQQISISADDDLYQDSISWSEVVGQLIKNPRDWAKCHGIPLANEKLHPDITIVLKYPPHWQKSESGATKAFVSVFKGTNVITVNPEDSPNPIPLPDSSHPDPNMRVTFVPGQFLGYWHYKPSPSRVLGTLRDWVDDPIGTLAQTQPPPNSALTQNLFISSGETPAPETYRAILTIDPDHPLEFIYVWNAKDEFDKPGECVKARASLNHKDMLDGGKEYHLKTNQIWHISYATPIESEEQA